MTRTSLLDAAAVSAARPARARACRPGAYLFLASAALSGYITGQIFEVNSGQIMP